MHSLNPRFDGAFLNLEAKSQESAMLGLNPRFDGAFLNFKRMSEMKSFFKS